MTREEDIRAKWEKLSIPKKKINESIEWLKNHKGCGEEWLGEEISPNKSFNRNCLEKPSQSG